MTHNYLINKPTKKQFLDAMAVVNAYCAKIMEDEKPQFAYQIGCRVQLSKWGMEMQNKSKRIGTVIHYSPFMGTTDGTVCVKWDKILTPHQMHISHVEPINTKK